MRNKRELIADTIESMKYFIESHDGFIELGEVEDNRAVIYYGGQCAECEARCIDDAIKERVPGIEIVPR